MNNLLDSFLQWLLATSLRASVLALTILALQLALGRRLPARWRHALWLPVVLVLLAPALPTSRFSVQNRFPAEPGLNFMEPMQDEVPPATTVTTAMAQPTSRRPGGRDLLLAGWLLGAGAVLVSGGLGYRRSLRRIRRGGVPTSAEVRQSVAGGAHLLGLHRNPEILMSSAVQSPAVAGLFRPLLLLPASFPHGFLEREARMVLLHELTHIQRRDLPLNWLLCVLQALHWFNPLLWLAFARMRADRETACDAQVLGLGTEDYRADYGHALLKLQSTVSSSGLSLAFVGIFERAGMRSRIRAIAMHRRSHPAWAMGAVLMIAVLTIVGATRAQDARAAIADQKQKAGWGKFVSFEDGSLTLDGQSGSLLWSNLAAGVQVYQWDPTARGYTAAPAATALSKVEAGTWVFVAEGRGQIRVGAAKEGHVTGTFVSYQDGKTLLLGKDLPVSSFTKKYGNSLKFPKFDENLPVFESIDGGDFTLAGPPSAILPKVKEGTLVTVYFGPSDGSFIRIEIGVRKEPVVDNATTTSAATTPADQMDKGGYGKFVSFKDGKLTLKGNYNGLVWNSIPENTPVLRWDDAASKYVPAGTAEVLSKLEPGTWTMVGQKIAIIRVGARKGSTTGTFVSFKDERLLMLGKDLGPAYTKKYGNQLHMNKFADDVPVYESIDGGDFVFVGHPATVLPKVKEGETITVYGAGDDNIVRLEIGVPNKK